jgi:TolB-like protein/tetratricopeptide (TPR) repeat protein
VEKHTLTRVVTLEEEQPDVPEMDTPRLPAQKLLAAGSVRRARWRWPAAFGLLVLLGAGVVAAFYWPRAGGKAAATAASSAAPKSIAVLPLKTIGAGGDGDEREYLGLGLSDALIARLGNTRRIIDRPTSAVRKYTDPQQDPLAAGREQGVDAVLDGTVQQDGDRIRVIVRLMRVSDGASLWAGQFDERLTDIFAVQDSVSRQVVQGLSLTLSDEEHERLVRRENPNVEAYQAYMKGRYFWNKRNPEGFRKAVEYFQRAIEIDPAYARAYAGLGDAYGFLGGSDPVAQAEAVAKQKAATKRALQLDETLSEAHASLGLIAMNADWDWAAAEREFKRAIELNPNYATAHQWYGEFLAYMGRFDEGLAEVKRAQELDPLSLIISTDVAKVYALARRYDEAIEQYRRALEMDAEFTEVHGLLAMTYSMKGMHGEAERELRRIEGLEEHPAYLSWLVYVYGWAGRKKEAQRALGQLKDLSRRTYVSPFWMATAYTGLGEKDEAFKYFEQAFAEHATGAAVTLKVNAIFDGLRSDPRFDDLLRRASFKT